MHVQMYIQNISCATCTCVATYMYMYMYIHVCYTYALLIPHYHSLRDASGKFPDYPDDEEGGSEAIFKKREEPVSVMCVCLCSCINYNGSL